MSIDFQELSINRVSVVTKYKQIYKQRSWLIWLVRVSCEVSKKKKNNDIESWLTAGCHTCWQLHGNQMKRFYSVVQLQTCRLHLPFIRCLPGNVKFEESSLASYLDILFTDWNASESNNQSLHSDKFKRRSRVTIQFQWRKMRKKRDKERFIRYEMSTRLFESIVTRTQSVSSVESIEKSMNDAVRW